MKKTFFLLIAMIMLFAVTVAPGCGKEPVKIGVILSLTGAGQAVGEDVRDGMLMAVDEVNDDGGVNGRKIELVMKDSGSNADNAQKAFQELENEYTPDLFIAQHSLNSMAVASLAEISEVVLIGLVTATPEFTQDKEWVWRYYSTAEEEKKVTMGILDELRVSDLAILYLDESMGHAFRDIFTEAFTQTGGTVISEPIPVSGADYPGLVGKVKNAEAVYISAYAAHISELLKELRKVHYQGYILTNSGSSSPAIVGLPEADGVYFPCPRIYNSEYPIGEQTKQEFEEQYDKALNHYSANGYDSIKLLANLFAEKEVTRESVKVLLDAGFIHPGILGTIYIEPGNHEISFPLFSAQILNGNIVFRY